MLQLEPSIDPFFVLDEGLNPDIARALTILGYAIHSVKEAFTGLDRAVEDPEIIDCIADNYGFRGVWITKDRSAKRQHIEQIKRRRISVIWIQQQDLSTKLQHRVITYGLARVEQDLRESRYPVHYLVTVHGQTNRERITYRTEWKGRPS